MKIVSLLLLSLGLMTAPAESNADDGTSHYQCSQPENIQIILRPYSYYQLPGIVPGSSPEQYVPVTIIACQDDGIDWNGVDTILSDGTSFSLGQIIYADGGEEIAHRCGPGNTIKEIHFKAPCHLDRSWEACHLGLVIRHPFSGFKSYNFGGYPVVACSDRNDGGVDLVLSNHSHYSLGKAVYADGTEFTYRCGENTIFETTSKCP